MNKTLIPLLTTFCDEEWKSLGKFLSQTYSPDSKIFIVYSFLKSNKERIEAFENILEIRVDHFPETSPSGFTKLISKLFSECERFLVTYTLLQDQNKSDLYLNEVYNARGLFNLANRKAKKVKTHIKSKTSYALSDQAMITQVLHQQCYSDNPIKYDKDIHLQQELIQHHFLHVQWQSFLYLSEAKNWSKITNDDLAEEVVILEKLVESFPNNQLSTLFRSLIKVIIALDVPSFLEIRENLYAGKFEINSELHTIMTLYLYSASIRLWRSGAYVDTDENVILIEYALSTGVFTHSGKIPNTRFLNLLSTLGTLKTFDWNEIFIERWINQVDTKSIDSTKAFAKALNAFNFKKYDLIFPLINNVEFENHPEKIRALGLELICLYIDRKNNYSMLRIFIANYKRTLKRGKDKMSLATIKSYLNLVKVIELLIQKDFRKLTLKLDKYQSIVYRSWVTEEVQKRESKT